MHQANSGECTCKQGKQYSYSKLRREAQLPTGQVNADVHGGEADRLEGDGLQQGKEATRRTRIHH